MRAACRAALKSHGADSDSVVLCTREHTYTCKHVQTTNSLLLCDTSQVRVLPLLPTEVHDTI